MSDMNVVMLIGRAAANPELRYTASGKPVASLRLITNRTYKDKESGDLKEVVTGHNVKFFGKLAEVIQKYVQKGKQIAVTGYLEARSYQPEGSNEKRYITEIVADTMQLLGSPAGEKAPDEMPTREEEDDVPF